MKIWRQSFKKFLLLPNSLPNVILDKIMEEIDEEI